MKPSIVYIKDGKVVEVEVDAATQFLQTLQDIHDLIEVSLWKTALLELAKDYKLDASCILQEV